MSDKPIWTGKYAGIDASVILRGSLPQPYLAGQLAVNRYDSGGIMEVAVRELAAEVERARKHIAKLEAWAVRARGRIVAESSFKGAELAKLHGDETFCEELDLLLHESAKDSDE